MPPPIVTSFESKEAHKFMAAINIKQYHVKLMSIGLKIQLCNTKDYELAMNNLKAQNIEFFSYTLDENKSVRYVLYGLPPMEIEEITAELKLCGLEPIKITSTAPKNPRHREEAIYFVSFKKGTMSLNQLRNIRYIAHTSCKWDSVYQSSRGPTQCHNCYMYGHGIKNCFRKPKCLFCGAQHIDNSECPNKETAPEHKCVNCGGNHPANSVQCSSRIRYIEIKRDINSRNFTSQKLQNQHRYHADEFPELPARHPRAGTDNNILTSSHWAASANANRMGGARFIDPAADSSLYNTNELLVIVREIIGGLKSCKSKEEQFNTIAEIAIRYAGLP